MNTKWPTRLRTKVLLGLSSPEGFYPSHSTSPGEDTMDSLSSTDQDEWI